MTTWSTLLSEVRILLSDTEREYKWTDAELLFYCKRAIQEYSKYFPFMSSATPTATEQSGVYTIESGWDVDRVSYLTGADYEVFLEELDRLPGLAMHVHARGWWCEGSTLYIFPTTLSDIEVYYYTSHPIPTDPTDELTVPEDDEGLIENFIVGMAMDRFIAKSALLDRWKERGARDDNPIIIPKLNWKREWAEALVQRMMERRIRWFAKGRDRPEQYSGEFDW